MSLDLEPLALPLTLDVHGVYRVGGTRVGLEQVLRAFHAGASPEDIAAKYETLRLADVYAVLAWYLAHREDADAYVAAAEAEEDRVTADLQARHGAMAGLRARLTARARPDR
jgi:uncharacterized protein (DUF433 family)